MDEGFDVGSTQLVTTLDPLLQQKAIELATLGQQFAGGVVGIAFGLEIRGEAVEVRSEQTPAEIDQGAFVFEPVFEHKNVVEKYGDKVNHRPFRFEAIPGKRSPFADFPAKKKPLHGKPRSGYVK